MALFIPFAFAGWIISDKPPPGFGNVSMGEPVNIYFQGAQVGGAYAMVSNGQMTLSKVTPLNLTDYGLKKEHIAAVMAALKQPNTNTNADYISDDSKKQILTYKDITRPVITKTVTLILNENNLNLYIFVNPTWIDTRINYAPSYLPSSSAGGSYFLSNQLGYHTLKSTNSTSTSTIINQIYGLSSGNSLLQASFHAVQQNNQSPILAVDNIQGSTHDNKKYYKAGMLALPQVNNIYQPQFFGFLTGDDTNILNTHGMLGSPIVVPIKSPSQVIIKNAQTNKFLYSQILYPGIQQINTANFMSGVYPINIEVTDFTGHTTNLSRLYIKNQHVPLLGHPQYNIGAGWLSNSSTKQFGSVHTPDYDFSIPTLFTSADIAVSYRSDVTLGLFNYTHNVLGSAMQTIYGNHYMFNYSGLASSGNSFGLGTTYTYITSNPKVSIYAQATKTWKGSDHYLNDDYQANGNIAYSISKGPYSASMFTGLYVQKDASPSIDYGISSSKTWMYLINNTNSAWVTFTTGYSNINRIYALASFSYNYLNGPNKVDFTTNASSFDPETNEQGLTLTPSLTGSTGWQHADRNLILAGGMYYNQGLQTNISSNYQSNALGAQAGYSTTSSTHNMDININSGITGNMHTIAFANLNRAGIIPVGVLIRVKANTNIPYRVQINGQDYGAGTTNTGDFIALRPFQTYSVSIIPTSVSHNHRQY